MRPFLERRGMNVWHICRSRCQPDSVEVGSDDTHVQHGGVVHVHRLLCVRCTVLIVEIDAGVVDEYVYAAVLGDFFGKTPDTCAVCDVELGV